MTLRKQIVEKVQRLPEESLLEVDKFLENFEEDSELNALAKLRKIRISATPDFSTTANIYPILEKNEK